MRGKKLLALVILILALAVAAFAGQNQQIQQKLAALEKIQGKFSFIVLGDNRSGDDVYRELVSLAMERKPDFIVNTGDMIETPGSKEDWAKFWDMSKPITVPYFLTVGNHDVHSKAPSSKKKYRKQVDLPGNEFYYSFPAGNSLFVVLDTSNDGQEKRIKGKQLKWLKEVLANTTQQHTFIFLHHPLYTEKGKGRHSGDGLDKYPQDRDRLNALFVKSRVDAVFTGHEHFYQRKAVDGVTQVITGGGGAPLYSKEEDGGFHHFVRVTVDGDKVSGEVVDINGRVRDRF